ncbi:hypothetical protein F6I03_08465 [Aerococcus sanguinicola]|uniref:Calcineurin-like phosphoesterase domain-containing protein n=3 Tax=Bacillati TaxID=1783272 RepID=A0A5N1GJ65_9LACT|nr:hypothetical protein F6I03_08465 [Aerococcus sanguinicola]
MLTASVALLVSLAATEVKAAEASTNEVNTELDGQTNPSSSTESPVEETTYTELAPGAYYDHRKNDFRVQAGNRYEAEAQVEAPQPATAQVKFGVGHAGDPNHLIWSAEGTPKSENKGLVQGESVAKDSSNDTHLFLFNQSDQPVKVNPASIKLQEKPYTAEELAAKEQELYASLPEPSQDFRVLPYLQSPSSHSIGLNWVSEFPQAGHAALYLDGKLVDQKEAAVTYLDLAEYTAKEIQQELSFKPGNGQTLSLPQGSWLNSNTNYLNHVAFDNLQANTRYDYVVKSGDSTYRQSFKTFPDANNWDKLRLIAFSDTETEPLGELENREWELHTITPYAPGSEERPGEGSAFHQKFGQQKRNGQFLVRYPLSQQTALNENLKHIEAAQPDALLIAGDLTQGAGYQPAWDEFFRHFAGEFTDIASSTPLLTALGNWETYAAINGGYGTPEDPRPAVISRNKYHDYFTTPGDPNNPQYKDSYYRTDIGPVTLLTLDSTKGIPDEKAGAYTTGKKYSESDRMLNPDLWVKQEDPYMTTDTQGSFTLEDYQKGFTQLYPGAKPEDSDIPTFNPGTEQWNWVVDQLNDARSKGQIILVQFHHAPYSAGVHGTPPNHEYADNQSGVAMRVYSPLFEAYGVAAVIAGHDEMFERSWIDSDQDGLGFQVFDVGVAADGLRGEKMVKNEAGNYVPLKYNTHSVWSATANEPEFWQTNDQGVKHLIDGGLHYGHLQMDIEKMPYGAKMIFQPVYVFPILDDNYDLVRTERRVYDDVTVMYFDHEGKLLAEEPLVDPIQPGKDQGQTKPGQETQEEPSQHQKGKILPTTVDQKEKSEEVTPEQGSHQTGTPAGEQSGTESVQATVKPAQASAQLADPVTSSQAVKSGSVSRVSEGKPSEAVAAHSQAKAFKGSQLPQTGMQSSGLLALALIGVGTVFSLNKKERKMK